MTSAQLEQCLQTLMPILKIDAQRYLIGTLQRQLICRNDNLLIRVGGGFMDFEKFVKQEARMECLKILKIMEQHDQTFQ